MSTMATMPAAFPLDETMVERVNAGIDALTLHPASAGAHDGGTFAHILACLRPGAPQERPLDWANDLARRFGSKATVLSVAPASRVITDLAHLAGWWQTLAEEDRRLRESGRRAVESAASQLRASGLDARAALREGSATEEIVRTARRRKVDLVVLGGPDGPRRLPGGVADSVKDRVGASLLVARGPPRPPRILIATDGSPASRHATAVALKLAATIPADVVVLHVLEHDGDVARLPVDGFLKDVVASLSLPVAPPRVTYALDVGRPAERICHKAREVGAGLIVMGARGLGALRGALVGSVSTRVMHAAEQSVLVVKSPWS